MDVGPGLPVSRKHRHTWSVLFAAQFKEGDGENTCSFDLYKSKYKLLCQTNLTAVPFFLKIISSKKQKI